MPETISEINDENEPILGQHADNGWLHQTHRPRQGRHHRHVEATHNKPGQTDDAQTQTQEKAAHMKSLDLAANTKTGETPNPGTVLLRDNKTEHAMTTKAKLP